MPTSDPDSFNTLKALKETSKSCVVNHTDVLAKIPGFEGHDGWRFINALSEFMNPALFLPGQDLISSGSVVENLIFLRRGEVAVLTGKDGTVPLETLRDNSLIGESALLGGECKHFATVRAVDFCDCRTVPVGTFKQLVKSFPKVKQRFSEIARERAVRMALSMQQPGRSSVTIGDRLHTLLHKARSRGPEAGRSVTLPGSLPSFIESEHDAPEKDGSDGPSSSGASRGKAFGSKRVSLSIECVETAETPRWQRGVSTASCTSKHSTASLSTSASLTSEHGDAPEKDSPGGGVPFYGSGCFIAATPRSTSNALRVHVATEEATECGGAMSDVFSSDRDTARSVYGSGCFIAATPRSTSNALRVHVATEESSEQGPDASEVLLSDRATARAVSKGSQSGRGRASAPLPPLCVRDCARPEEHAPMLPPSSAKPQPQRRSPRACSWRPSTNGPASTNGASWLRKFASSEPASTNVDASSTPTTPGRLPTPRSQSARRSMAHAYGRRKSTRLFSSGR